MQRIGSTLEALDEMNTDDWLRQHDPDHRDRKHPYPFHSPKQSRLRRRREICCGIMDMSGTYVQEAFRRSTAEYPSFEHDGDA